MSTQIPNNIKVELKPPLLKVDDFMHKNMCIIVVIVKVGFVIDYSYVH